MLKNEDPDRILCFQEYSEDSNSEPDVDLENQYYGSKSLKETDPRQALESFEKVGDVEQVIIRNNDIAKDFNALIWFLAEYLLIY